MSTMIYNVTAVLMDPAHTVLPNAYVVVDGHKITDFGAQRPQGFTGKCIDGKGGILMPGLVNAHTHVPMTAMRGYGDGNNLQDWLHNFIFPVEAKWDDRAIRACAALGLAEMIASGVTCIADMYMHTDAVLREVESAGISANVSCGGVQFEEPFDPDKNHDCVVQRALTEKWHGRDDGRIQVDASIHGEYTSHAGLWDWMARYAADHGLGMHVHLSETQAEHEQCKARHGGKSPAAVLAEHGVFDVRAIAAHCVWIEGEDFDILRDKGVTVAHNPSSNMKLGSGFAPVKKMLEAGIRVGIGTDGAASNNNLNMLEEVTLASMIGKGINGDPTFLGPRQLLELSCRNGALAQGRTDCGALEVGSRADIVVYDLDKPHLQPVYEALPNLFYAAGASDICLNMIDGEVVYRDGVLTRIDEEKVMAEARSRSARILSEL